MDMQLLQKLKDTGQVPNALTWARIVLTPVPITLILLYPTDPVFRWWAVAAFVVIVATDKLDGYLARRWEQVSDFGKIIDPAADKVLVIGLVISLCWTNILASPWGWTFLLLNLIREGGVAIIRYQHKKGERDLIVPADEDGKRKMFLQSVGIGAALVPLPYWWWQIVIWLPLVVSLFYSARSGKHYLQA